VTTRKGKGRFATLAEKFANLCGGKRTTPASKSSKLKIDHGQDQPAGPSPAATPSTRRRLADYSRVDRLRIISEHHLLRLRASRAAADAAH